MTSLQNLPFSPKISPKMPSKLLLDFFTNFNHKITKFGVQNRSKITQKSVSEPNVSKIEKPYKTLAGRSEIKGQRFPNRAKIEDFQQKYRFQNRSQIQLRFLLDFAQFGNTFGAILESF